MLGDDGLKQVKDEGTILSLISTAKEESFHVFVWKLVGSEKHIAQVRIESVRKLRRDFSIIPGDGQEQSVQDLLSGRGHIDLYIPNSALLLRCQIKQTDAPLRYYLQMPDFVAQVERRKNRRLKVYDGAEVQVSFSKSVSVPTLMTQFFLKNCMDISGGGFSFLVSKMESKFFHIGDSIASVEVKAGKWSVKLPSEITAIRELAPSELNSLNYKVWRICCKFTKIDQISKMHIDQFILERIKEELHAISK